MSSLPTVLILTNSEHGQSNVNLAISYELALAGVNVHIASSPPLGTRVARLQELINRHGFRSSDSDRATGSVIFHGCEDITPYVEAIRKHGLDITDLPHPHGVLGALECYSKLDVAYFPWSQEEYLASIASIKETITTTKPDVVVVDSFFYAARDACELMGQKFMVISATGIKEAATSVQPYLATYWKYPAVGSGFPFPLKWWQIPLNIYLCIRLFAQMMTSVKTKQMHALRRSLGLKDPMDARPLPGVTYICPALSEIDFPFPVIPEELLLCGPIVIPFDPLEESDPGLVEWLDIGPTVLVNLGSQIVSDERVATEMASAFRLLIDYHEQGSGKIQLLWKVKAIGDIQGVLDQIIGKEIKEGRVKVVAWLDVEPVSILQHPNVVCTVHHGGANSFYEGVWSGVPHVVLPVWFDTYDYAQRAEFLNIGVFGSKTGAPGVYAEELGNALVRVTGNSEEALKLRTSAKHLKEICRAKGNGRELASVAILKEWRGLPSE